MTDELDTLRPEVADAVSALDETTCMTNPGLKWYATIRAELLRLARNDADARIALDADHDWKEMYERAKKAEAELAALKARMEWRPVETAPVGHDVLTCAPTTFPWDIECKHADGKWERDNPPPTHWMPLPPPKVEE